MSRWSSLRLSFTLFSLLCTSRAQISTDCPTEIQLYNASGLLGFFDSLASGPVPPETFDPIVDNNGYLYHTDDSSPAPPATFAYSRIVSETTVPSDNGSFPAIITTLLGTVPPKQNRECHTYRPQLLRPVRSLLFLSPPQSPFTYHALRSR